MQIQVELPRFVFAPVSKGDLLGSVTLKEKGREVLLAWCNDACPGDDKSIFGFPAIEEDGIPVYVAVSTRDGGKIVNRTKRYGESGNPDIVFFKQYDCKHAELSAAAAEDIKDTLRTYEE